MFRNEILDALKAQFQGVSDKILGRVADNLAKTVTKPEDVQTAVDGVTFQQVLDSYGDSRATDATKTAVLNYEKKHNIKDGKPVAAVEEPKPQETAPLPEETPAWAQAIAKSVETLANTVSKMQGAELTKSRKQKLAEVLQSLPEINRKGYERIPLDSMTEEDFNTLLTEIQGEVGEIGKQQSWRGAVFGQPTKSQRQQQSDNHKEATDDEAKAVVDKMNI